MKRRSAQILVALVIAALWGASLGWAHWRGGIPLLERIEAPLTDLRTLVRGEREAPDIVTILAIDDDTVDLAGAFPLRRDSLAEIIRRVARHGPIAIAVDMLLVDRGSAEEDQRLAQALELAPSVIAGAAVFAGGRQRLSTGSMDAPLAEVPVAERFLLPQAVYSDAAAIGIVNVATDPTGTPRFVPLLFRTRDRIEASFAFRSAAIALDAVPAIEPGRLILDGKTIRTDIGYTLPLSFYGPGGTVRTVSAAAALRDELPPEAIAGRVVVLGATVTGGGDVFPTPFDPVLPGVEVMATAIAQVMVGDGLLRDRSVRLADAGLAVALPVILVGLLAWRRNVIGLAAILAVMGVWLALNQAAFNRGIWMSLAVPLAAAVPAAIVFGTVQLWMDRSRAQYYAAQSALLQRIQAPGLTKWLARDPDFLAEPVRLEAAIVFIDLSGYTGLSESLGPNATRGLLNEFYEFVNEEVTAKGGAITSFMGDGLMILFGLPRPGPDDAANALRCAGRLCERTGQWLAAQPNSISDRLGFKIGMHFGQVVASRLGSGANQQIATTGDSVNVASRLMDVAARQEADLAISDDLIQAAGQACAYLQGGLSDGPMEVQLRGRTTSLKVWLYSRPETP